MQLTSAHITRLSPHSRSKLAPEPGTGNVTKCRTLEQWRSKDFTALPLACVAAISPLSPVFCGLSRPRQLEVSLYRGFEASEPCVPLHGYLLVCLA